MRKDKPSIGIFTYDFFPIFGGQGRHIYELYKQNQTYNNVKMFIFSPNTNKLANHIQLFPETKKSKLKNLDYSIKLHRRLPKLIEKYKLDIIHLHGGPGGLFLFRKVEIPVIYTCHHTYWQQYHYIKSQSWKYLFYLLEKKSYQFADKVICVSQDTQSILANYYTIKTDHLLYIPNGIGRTVHHKNYLLKKKNILYVGRIDKRKGVDFLIETMSVVNARNKDIALFVVGVGNDKNNLEHYSKKRHLPIIFFGHLDDKKLQQLYRQVIIQVVPSLFEGFGISVLEGMTQGVPIIGTDVDGIRSIIKHNHSGILVPYADKQALADSILSLSNNPSLQKKLIANAYKTLSYYDWKNIYSQTIQTYEKLIS